MSLRPSRIGRVAIDDWKPCPALDRYIYPSGDMASATSFVGIAMPTEAQPKKKRGPYTLRRPADKNYLTRAEAAQFLGLSESSLAHWSCHGKGPELRMVGRKSFYHLHELNVWLAGQAGTRRIGL